MDSNYIFNIPINHISALLHAVYPDKAERHSLVNQECGEFLQVFSKYTLARDRIKADATDLCDTRAKLIEEMTHVLVCFGMLAVEQGITQDDINNEIRKKAIPGVSYPFEEDKKHISLEDLLNSLKVCETPRNPLSQSDNSCKNCTYHGEVDYTVVCRPMLREALYYLKKYGEHKQSVANDRVDEKKSS